MVVIDVDEVHLLSDALQGGFLAERFKIGADETVRVLRYGLQIDILGELHILSVNPQDLHSSNLVGHADVNFSVETTGTTKSWVDSVGSVRRADDNDLTTALGAVHQSEELGDDSLLDLAL